MREQVENLIRLGKMPESEADLDRIEAFERLLLEIEPPITSDEAAALASLFNEDDCYGTAWSLLHLIETAPVESLEELQGEGKWIALLKQRLRNRTIDPSTESGAGRLGDSEVLK